MSMDRKESLVRKHNFFVYHLSLILTNMRNSLFYILYVLFLFLVQSLQDEANMIRFSYWPFCSMTQKIGDV